MKIGIIETHYHSEFIHTLVQIFKKENIDVYLTRNVYDELDSKSKGIPKSFIFKPEHQKTKNFISDIPTENYDLLFVNTIQPSMIDIPNWKYFNPKCKTILTLHNLNAWNNHKFHLRKNLAHSLDSYIASFYTKKILKKFTHINIVYPLMIDLAQKYFGATHKILNIPYAFAQEDIITDKKETIDFVIPGVVSKTRRNYEPVINAFNRLSKKHEHTRLILLGKNKDNLTFKKHVGVEEKIITFDKRVSTVEYNEYLRNSDFIIIPNFFLTHSVNTIDEFYGFSKSPSINEVIKWRKPLIIPEHIPVDYHLTTSTIKYENTNQLYYWMERVITVKDLRNQITKNAIKDTKSFTLKNIRKSIYKELEL